MDIYRELVGLVRDHHLDELAIELKNAMSPYASVVFDGTTFDGEVFGVLLKFWNAENRISIKV